MDGPQPNAMFQDLTSELHEALLVHINFTYKVHVVVEWPLSAFKSAFF